MSIIYDALKKVERKLETPNKKTKSKSRRIYLYCVLVALSGLFIAKFSFDIFINQPQQALPLTSPPLKLEPLQEPDLEKSDLPPLVLNGVFFSENQGYALINNRILKEGDTFEGVKIGKITLDEVELEFAGKSVKLSTQK